MSLGSAALSFAIPLAAAAQGNAAADSWPRWRGARFNSTAITAGSVLSKPFALRVRWRKSIGAGYSGVVVADGHAVTMASDGKADYVLSLSSDTGAENWRVSLADAFPGRDGSTGGPISTPAIDAGVVYALGPRGELVAVRLATGKELWRRQIATELGAEAPHWGFTTSPLVTGDVVIIETGGSPKRAVTAFNRKTGATVWRSGSDTVKYSSPILMQLGGRDVLIWGGDQGLAALDPKNGRELWSIPHGGRKLVSGIPLGISQESNFLNPVVIAPDQLLLQYRYADEAVQLVQVSAGAKPQLGWTTRELKLSFATPVVHGSHVYGYSGGFLSCVDARTGELVWRSRAPGGGFPIVVDGHLVVLTNEGAVVIAEASPAGFKEKLSFEMFSHEVWSPPAFAEGRIYARDSHAEMAALDIVPVSPATTTATDSAKEVLGEVPTSAFARWVSEVQGKPDAATRVKQYLDTQKKFPVIEGDRYAHVIYQGQEKDVFLRSDALERGQEIRMHHIAGTDVHYASFELEPDARLAYQLERNLGESFTDPKNPRQAGRAFMTGGPVSLLLMPNARQSLPGSVSQLRGRIVELEIESPIARAEALSWGGKRNVRVYLPPGYDSDTARRYPVLYVLYGAQMQAEAHLDAMLDGAIGDALAPMIAVFVDSNNAYEYARTFREQHRRMLAEQLVPWIDGQFRTLPSAAGRTLLGVHEAGFGVLETALHYPSVFGNAIAESALPLSTGERDLLALVEQGPKQPQRFYLEWGRYDLRSSSDLTDVARFTKKVSDRLHARGFQVTGREYHDGTALVFWGERLMNPLQELFQAK